MKRAIKRIVIGLIVLQVAAAAGGLILRRLFPSTGDEESDELGLVAILTGLELESRAPAFRGGSVMTVLGGVELDLREAQIAPGGAALRTQTFCGGLEIRVPPGWRVVAHGTPVMGGIDNRTEEDVLADDAPLLTVDAVAVMGGVSIRR